jgi:predicted nucleic acid-binding protein
LRVVLDTCILKLATFPAENNASALISELARAGLIEAWVSPAIVEEYADVLGNYPDFVVEKRRELSRVLSADRAQCYPARTGQPVPGKCACSE